jgi:hypothetical protein
MSRLSTVVLILLAVCDGGGSDTPDAAPHDGKSIDAPGSTGTSCLNPVPTTAADSLTISGDMTDGSLTGPGNATSGATISAFHTTGSALGTTTTEATGIYQVTATTGGATVDYLTATNAGYKDMRYFPRAPLAKSTSLGTLPLFTTADAGTIATTFGVTQDPAKGLALVTIQDCFGSLRANGTVTLSPATAGTVKYLHGDGTTTGTATDATGFAVVFNIPAGSVTIGATVGGTAYHEHAVTASASYLTITTISEQ